jgi:polysaccharide chain length determinant protein (PEP-CTERM system associated)
MVGALIALIRDEARRIWCYKWLGLATSALIFCAGAVYVLHAPNVYDAWGQIFVNKQTPVAAAAEGVSLVGANYGSPYVVAKTMLNDQNLELVARRLDPAAAKLNKLQMTRAVTALRSQITVPPDQGDGFFELHVRDSDPARARRVVQVLLDEFISRNLTRSQRELAQAGRFLDDQIASYEAMLATSQVKIAAFRQSHPVVAATPLPPTFDPMASDLPAARAAYETALAQSTTPAAARPSAVAERVYALQAKLAALRIQYTDQHPDVVSTRRQLADAVAERDEELRQATLAPAATPATATANPALEAARRRLQEAQRAATPRQVAAPVVPPNLQSQWAELQRNDEALRIAYQQLIGRREAARMSTAVYGADGSAKYQITRRPTVPDFPIAPNRRLLMAMAAVIAVGGGLGAAYVVAAVKGIFVSPRELENAFQLPVIGTVAWEPAWSTKPGLRAPRPLASLRALLGGGSSR